MEDEWNDEEEKTKEYKRRTLKDDEDQKMGSGQKNSHKKDSQ
jgi:hypothetical protein